MYRARYLRLLLPLLAVLFAFLALSPSPTYAAHCAFPTAGEDIAVTTVTPQTVEIFLVDKATLGTARFQNVAIDYCVGTDDAGVITVEFLKTDGTTLATQIVTDNTHFSYTPNTIYVGPVRIKITDSSAAQATSNYFFAVAPPVPAVSQNPRPSYAIGGQLFNPVFNAGLPSPATTSAYFPNPALLRHGPDNARLPGLYADDATYATDSHIDNIWIVFYWWLTASPEGFPAWTVTFSNEVRNVTGDPIDLQTLVAAQDRTFTPDTDYTGFILLLADRTVGDFETNGWFDQLDTSLVGTASSFLGTWKPAHSGTYGASAVSIPVSLNGGYLFLVAEPTDTMVRFDLLTAPADLTSATGLLFNSDNIISGEVSFHPTTNSRTVNYVGQLLDDQGQLIQSILIANTDGITISRVPFAFLETSILFSGKVVIKEAGDIQLPAVLVNIAHEDLSSLLISPTRDSGLSRYLNSAVVTGSGLITTFAEVGSSWSLGQGTGNVAVALTAIGFLVLGVMFYIRIVAVGVFAGFLGLLFFTLIGILPPTWFLLVMMSIIIGIGWKMFGATA